MLDDLLNEAKNKTKLYLEQKAPPESNRKKVLTGLKQQQLISSYFQRPNLNLQETSKSDTGSNTVDDKGWGRVR